MIRINLLPTKRRKKPRPLPKFLIFTALSTVLIVIVTFYVFIFLKKQVSDLEAQKKANVEKLAELNEKIKEVRNYEELNRIFTERNDIVEQLRKYQSQPVRVLDELANSLTDGVWFTALMVSDNKIEIEGIGFTNSEIVRFVESLKASERFSDIYLHETKQTIKEKIEVYTFKISLGIKA